MPRTKYRFHTACTVFPQLPDEDLQSLAEDIAHNGLRNPIVLWQGKILDGRNRYLACEIAGVKPRFTEFDGDDPIGWVISQNLHRRHLTASQKAVIALDLLPLLEREAKQRQRESNSHRGNGQLAKIFANQGKAAEAAAKIVGVNSRYVELAKEVRTKSPKLIEDIKQGKLTISLAAQLAKNGNNGKPTKRSKISGDDRTRVLHGDCVDLIPRLQNESIQLVLTSPPYAQQRIGHYLSVSEEDYPAWTVRWMEPLWDKLTPDGSVLIIIRPHIKNGVLSDYVLKTRLALRDDGWTECEELIWIKPDAPPLGSNRRPRRTWESILWFGKSANPYVNLTACGRESSRVGFVGSFRFGIGGDSPVSTGQAAQVKQGISRCTDIIVAPIGSIESGLDHPAMFPVSLAEQLISTFSRERDLVVDPFCGSGTSLVAAKRLGREYRGFDVEKKYVKMALQRLAW